MRRFVLLIWVLLLIFPLQSVGLESEWIVDEEAEDTFRDQAHYLMQGMQGFRCVVGDRVAVVPFQFSGFSSHQAVLVVVVGCLHELVVLLLS